MKDICVHVVVLRKRRKFTVYPHYGRHGILKRYKFRNVFSICGRLALWGRNNFFKN
jgi:hypothetical protein